jgi:hypothetical protein
LNSLRALFHRSFIVASFHDVQKIILQALIKLILTQLVHTNLRRTCYKPKIVMPGPYRSKLNEHRKEIADLRKTHPPTPYSQIAEILFEKYKIKIRASSIWSFVKARSIEGERKLKYVIAEEGTPAPQPPPAQPAVEVNAKKEETHTESLSEKKRKESGKEDQKNQTKIFDDTHFI